MAEAPVNLDALRLWKICISPPAEDVKIIMCHLHREKEPFEGYFKDGHYRTRDGEKVAPMWWRSKTEGGE